MANAGWRETAFLPEIYLHTFRLICGMCPLYTTCCGKIYCQKSWKHFICPKLLQPSKNSFPPTRPAQVKLVSFCLDRRVREKKKEVLLSLHLAMISAIDNPSSMAQQVLFCNLGVGLRHCVGHIFSVCLRLASAKWPFVWVSIKVTSLLARRL